MALIRRRHRIPEHLHGYLRHGARDRVGTLVYYTVGKGGRICDLSPEYLDALAFAVRYGTVYELNRGMVRCLVSGDFACSYLEDDIRAYYSKKGVKL